jgi:predicted dehydrogenase
MNSFTATAERGSFGMQPAYSYRGNRGWRSDGAGLAFPQIDQFVAELDDFAECILTGRKTRVPGEEGLRDVRIIMAAYQAARSGQPVRLAAG